MKAENLRHWRKFRRAAAKFHGCGGAFSAFQAAPRKTIIGLRVPNPRFVRVGPLTLLFSYSSRIQRNHSTALIAVQPSFSTIHCKTLDPSVLVC
jgi:hypothetical protein